MGGFWRTIGLAVATVAWGCVAAGAQETGMGAKVADDAYRGELVSFPGPWAFQIGKSAIILVSDQELEALSDPDKVLNLSLTFQKQEGSLRQVCERAKAAGQRTLILAFDHFFSQYRPGQAGPRKLMPDMDDYVRRIAAISKFAQGYGLGLELSLLSPLEVGAAFRRQTGDSGLWYHYREGLRDPKSGAYTVELWRQTEWVNNKGPIKVEDAGVRVFAFHEQPVGGTLYRVVDPKLMVEITDSAKVEVLGPQRDRAVRIRVYGTGPADAGNLDRVLAVQQYRTPEMDYFSPKALPFLNGLVDKYADAGVKLNGLYSDEMHIQQDWSYFDHHDAGQFALRYASPGFCRRFAELYGAEYADLAKYMVYFAYAQEDFANDLTAGAHTMHVFGASPEEIRRTALFRARCYHLLQDGVVDLFVAAKRHAEERMGHRLEARAHATWAESPTIDKWYTGNDPMFRSAYEYTSNFVWSNTVQQAASACYDYFKWGDYLTGNGNDHAEGGWADRDYYALALGCSTGILNEVPYSYAAHWGMPDELSRRRGSLVNAFGTAGSPLYGMVQDMQHRDVDVLMLYPLDLVAVEERFGSWTTQYGYANMVTAAKLLERGKVVNGAIEMAGRRFTTLVATFEPFPSRSLLAMMRHMAESGGRVIWSGPPPMLTLEGEAALAEWQQLFGAEYHPGADEGHMAPGKEVRFEGRLARVPLQTILTDFLVDRIFPVAPQAGVETVARVNGQVVGTCRALAGGGTATFLGFRPRDDQSKSLGYEPRSWFEALNALGAYNAAPKPEWPLPGTRDTPEDTIVTAPGDDNTEYLSRTTQYLCCRFPNGAVAIAPHWRETEEGWSGGFARDAAQDKAYLERNPPPPDTLHLKDFHVNGHVVSFDGDQAMTFRVDRQGRLIAFAGSNCSRITLDGHETVFADHPIPQLAWAPVPKERRVPGGAVLQMMVYGEGVLRIPAPGLPANVRLYAEGATPGSRGAEVALRREGGLLSFTVTGKESGLWLYAVTGR